MNQVRETGDLLLRYMTLYQQYGKGSQECKNFMAGLTEEQRAALNDMSKAIMRLMDIKVQEVPTDEPNNPSTT